MAHASPPSPDLPASAEASTPGRWTVGTLSYGVGSLIVLFLVLLAGDFAWSMKERSVMPLFQILLKQVKISDFWSGLLVGSIPAIITVVVGPIVSVWSDRLRTPWGRRIPFLALPTPVIVLAMVGLAYSPVLGPWLNQLAGGAPEQDRLWIIALFALFWTLFEVFTIVANAVFNGLVNDVVPRQFIGRFFGLFRMVSLSAGIFFNFSLIKHAETHAQPIFLGIAATYAIGFTAMCLFVKEGTYPPPPPIEERARGPRAVLAYFRECMSQPFYRWVFAAMAFGMACFAPVNLFSVYAAKGFGMSMEDFGWYNAVSYIVSLCLAFPLGWLTDRFHPVITGGITLFLYATLMFLAYFLMHDQTSYGIALVAHTVLSGAFFTTTAGITLQLFPRDRFTQLYSMTWLLFNLLQSLVGPVMGRFLDLNDHDYKFTYLAGSLMATTGLVAWAFLYQRFMRLGGLKGYRAPEI